MADTKAKAKQGSSVSIVGGAASKIQNNLEKQTEQFSWKIAFPSKVKVADIPKENVMILNSDLQMVACEFSYNIEANSILISPNYKYKVRTNYFFIAKYMVKKKPLDTCVAFFLMENNTMRTYDERTSKAMIRDISRQKAKNAQTQVPTPPPAENNAEK